MIQDSRYLLSKRDRETETIVMVVVTTIDGNNNESAYDTLSSSSSFVPRDVVYRGGDSGRSSMYALLSQKLGTSSIRKYNRSIDDAIRADDVPAVRVMLKMEGGGRDRSMIDNIYAVAYYLGRKNIADSIDDILSLSENDDEKKKRLCQSIASSAARHGHLDLVIEMIRRGANDWNWIAYSAARGGHKDIVTEMIRRGANDWDGIACSAAGGGHMDIVAAMVESRGATNWN